MSDQRERDQVWLGLASALLLIAIILLLGEWGAGDSQAEAPAGETPTPASDPLAPEAVIPLVESPSPAVHVSIWWDEQIALRDLQLAREMGFYWIKQKFAWRDIQPMGPGSFDWYHTDAIVNRAEEYGLNLIVRLDRQPFWAQVDGGVLPLENAPPADYAYFEEFCYAVADRYAGRIRAYQVWNEPNLAREWGDQPPDPEAYVDLLAYCYRGIKRGDPGAIVISAGLSPTGTSSEIAMPHDEFLIRMYEAGAAEYFDMLGYNAPGYAAPPTLDPAEVARRPELGGHEWNSFRHTERIREIMVEAGDAEKQLAILEMGWTTDPIHPEYSWFAVSEEQQAEYLASAFWWAHDHWQPWIAFVTAIYIPDPSWTEESEQYWWAISYPDWPETRVRPAYYALQGLPDWWGLPEGQRPILDPTPESTARP